MSLENAPDEIKLAVDLIMLLEENKVPAQTVLAALEIIRRDYENKVKSAEGASQNAPEYSVAESVGVAESSPAPYHHG